MSLPTRPTLAARSITFGDLTIVPSAIDAVRLCKPEGIPRWWVQVWMHGHEFAIAEREGIATNEDAQQVYEFLRERMGAR